MQHQEKYLRAAKVAERLDISKSTLYRYVRAGLFPKSVQLFPGGRSVWRSSDIAEFIEKMRGESS